MKNHPMKVLFAEDLPCVLRDWFNYMLELGVDLGGVSVEQAIQKARDEVFFCESSGHEWHVTASASALDRLVASNHYKLCFLDRGLSDYFSDDAAARLVQQEPLPTHIFLCSLDVDDQINGLIRAKSNVFGRLHRNGTIVKAGKDLSPHYSKIESALGIERLPKIVSTPVAMEEAETQAPMRSSLMARYGFRLLDLGLRLVRPNKG